MIFPLAKRLDRTANYLSGSKKQKQKNSPIFGLYEVSSDSNMAGSEVLDEEVTESVEAQGAISD